MGLRISIVTLSMTQVAEMLRPYRYICQYDCTLLKATFCLLHPAAFLTMLKQKQIISLIFPTFWLLFLSTLAFLWNLGATNLVDETEPLFAEASRQMTITGDWITPYFNEQTRFDKPPLIYWTQAIAYLLIGVNEWAVRLPSALSAIGLMGLLFYTLCKCTQISSE
jgi:hypothetical protein